MRPLLALAVLLVAGCSGTGGHGGHDEMVVVLGVTNAGTARAGFELRVEGPVGSGPMVAQVALDPGDTAERRFNITNEGPHRAVVQWARGVASESWRPEECGSFHVVFSIDPNETGEVTPDRTRECH
ncbi:MAG TPA: hypothetical protein VNX21_04435 [Candidatus Thermoplasmatota archaeon]|nr:hypothetical protein [Candidatus Thermoplasmatota archaeon]